MVSAALPPRHGSSVLLWVVFFLFSGTAAAGEITLLEPAESGIIYARNPSYYAVVEATDRSDADRMVITSGATPIKPLAVRSGGGRHYVHFQLPLSPGANLFTITPGNKKISLDYKPMRTVLTVNFDVPGVYMFHRHGTMRKECRQCHEAENVPKKFAGKPLPFGMNSVVCYSCHRRIFEDTAWHHSPAESLLCETCHPQDAKAGRFFVSKGKDASLCYRCHVEKERVWSKMKHVHQPVGFGVCSMCHNPHGDANRYQLWADGKVDLCISCHVDKEQYVTKEVEGMTTHGIINGGGCVACHDPHGTDNPYMLYRPVNELCVGCHNKLEGVVKGHPVGGHPVAGPKNPLQPDKEFNCASCHNPHGSVYQYLLVGDLLGGHVCSRCHN